MFSVERRVFLVLRRDLPRFVVPFRALVIREFAAGYNFGYFSTPNPFLELRIPVIVDWDDGYL